MIFISFFNIAANAEGKDKKTAAPAKVTWFPTRTFLDINNISTQFYNNGNSDIDPSGNSGFIFPKGSYKACVFESGLLWGAKVTGDPQPRVGGAAYIQGLQGGRVISPGVPEDPDGASVRIYRVRPDVYPGGPFVLDLYSDAINEGTDAQTLRLQYEKDWTEWPYDIGAPFWTDSLGLKHPGIKDADQTISYVANDMNPILTTSMYGAQPLGIEMQTTIWAYNHNEELKNTLFRKYKLINKSQGVTFDSMYVSQWSDIDIGDAADDYSGCDTNLNLGYTYNARDKDAVYNPLPPPALVLTYYRDQLLLV